MSTIKEEIFVWHFRSFRRIEKCTKLISIPNFLPHGLQAFRSSLLVFTFFGLLESTKLNSVRKVFDGKVRNFLPTKISFFFTVTDYLRPRKSKINSFSQEFCQQRFAGLQMAISGDDPGLIDQPYQLQKALSGALCNADMHVCDHTSFLSREGGGFTKVKDVAF